MKFVIRGPGRNLAWRPKFFYFVQINCTEISSSQDEISSEEHSRIEYISSSSVYFQVILLEIKIRIYRFLFLPEWLLKAGMSGRNTNPVVGSHLPETLGLRQCLPQPSLSGRLLQAGGGEEHLLLPLWSHVELLLRGLASPQPGTSGQE